MRRVGALLAAVAIAAPATARDAPTFGEPADIIAAEIAFARLAQDKGQWTAFRATAAPDAKMFAGGPVRVAAFLQGKPNPLVSVRWQPYAVWEACDGSYGVTRGAWQRPNSTGWFITVWQRQGKKATYKWVLDQGDVLAAPLAAPEMIAAKLADCPARRFHDDEPRRPVPAKPEGPRDYLTGTSDDGTLDWATVIAADGRRNFTLRLKQDGIMRVVLQAQGQP